MDNPEKLMILDTQDTGRRQTKQKHTTQKANKISNTNPTKTGDELSLREGQEVIASYNTPAMLLIWSIRVGHHYAHTNIKIIYIVQNNLWN